MEQKVKHLGRTYSIDGTIWCAFSGTGIEFEFTGRKLEITLAGDGAVNGNRSGMARAAIYLDGNRVIDDMLDAPEKTYTVFESADRRTAAVKIVKLSESAMSTLGIRPIPTGEGEYMIPTAAKPHRIEFVGDSITCGYGVDDEVAEHSFSTETEDVTRAYAVKCANLLDADYSIVSSSGYGIISGYTDDPAVRIRQLLPPYYEKLGFSYHAFARRISPQDLDWDFTRFSPEAVVINLGTNDSSYCKDDAGKQNEYSAQYTEFLKKIRHRNPKSELFCVLGVMGQELCPAMERAAAAYTAETKDAHIHCVTLESQTDASGYVADYHPRATTHDIAAKTAANAIKAVMGW